MDDVAKVLTKLVFERTVELILIQHRVSNSVDKIVQGNTNNIVENLRSVINT